MADNTVLNTGTGGDSVRDKDRAGVKTQIVGIDVAIGTGTESLMSSTSPMPVSNGDGTTSESVFPAAFLRTTDEPRQVFYDPFDAALDTTNRWTTPTNSAGGVLASTTSGTMSLATGTTASGWSKLSTQASFVPSVPAWTGYSFAIALPDGAAPIANSYRFWGAGTPATNPTTAAPMTDAVGFELATTGKMYAVVYAAGVRTQIADLSTSGTSKQPTDANMHRYIVYVRTDRAYWYIDGIVASTLVATSNFQSPAVQTLPESFLAVGFSTPPVSSAQIQCSGCAVWDTGKNATQVADGTYPWRKVSVGKNGGLSIKGSSIAGQTLNVSAATPVTGAGLDVSEAGNVTFVVKNTVAATAYTGAPVIVFEQSDDDVSWGPLPVVRSDTGVVGSTLTFGAGAANAEIMMDAGVEGVNWVRARVTTAQTANGMTIVIQPGGGPFSPSVAVTNSVGIAAGTADIGNVIVRNNQMEYELDVPGLTTTAYTAGDQFGTLITIPNAARVAGGTGFINGIMYHDNESKMGAIDILFFNDVPTLALDNAAFSISAADARKIVWWGNLTYLSNIAALARFGQLQGISVPYFCTATSLYVAIITRISPSALTTPASTQHIRFLLSRD